MKKIKLKIILWLIGPIPKLDSLTDIAYKEIWPKHSLYQARTKQTLFWVILQAYLYGRKEKELNMNPPKKSPLKAGLSGRIMIFDDVLKEQIKNMD